jgi:hypothetical protein
MTGLNFYTYVLAILKRTDKSTEVYQSMTDTVRDMRLRFLSEDFKSINTALTISTIGNYSSALPSDFGHLIGDVMIKETSADESYPPLNKISIEEYNSKYPDRFNTTVGNRMTGFPYDYCIFGGNLLVGPPVDKTTYEFRFAYSTEDEVEISSGTSNVPFTDRYRKTVRYGVLKEMYLSLENYEEADVWSKLYEIDLQKIIENDKQNVKDNLPIKYSGI